MPELKPVLFFGFLLLLFTASCDKDPSRSAPYHGAGRPVPDSERPVLYFAEPEFDFGHMNEGEEVSHDFVFTNKGKSDLIISQASASCGCTVPRWPREPIPPGEGGKISVTFNSAGKSGQQNKKVVITANTRPELTEVLLKGMVRAKNATKP